MSEAKTIEENFIDWESSTFGFGYGSGEPHVIPALKTFLKMVPADGAGTYDYESLESGLGPVVAWLLINALCRARMIEYGTSPRFGWLTKRGEALKAFVASKSADDLVMLCVDHPDDYVGCSPDACNCGPNGYEEGRKCHNPFWCA